MIAHIVALALLGQASVNPVSPAQLTPSGTGVATSGPLTLGVDCNPGVGSDSNACTLASPCASIQGAVKKVPKSVTYPVTIVVDAGVCAPFVLSGFTIDQTNWLDAGFVDAGFSVMGTMITAALTGASSTMGTISAVSAGNIQTWTDLSALAPGWDAGELVNDYFCDTTLSICQVIHANDAGVVTTSNPWPVTPSNGDTWVIETPGTKITGTLPYATGIGYPVSGPGGAPTSNGATAVYVGQNNAALTAGRRWPILSIENMKFESLAPVGSAIVVSGPTQTLGLRNVSILTAGTTSIRLLGGANLFGFGLAVNNNNAAVQCLGEDTNLGGCGRLTIENSNIITGSSAGLSLQGGDSAIYSSTLNTSSSGISLAVSGNVESKGNHYIGGCSASVLAQAGPDFSDLAHVIVDSDNVVNCTNAYEATGLTFMGVRGSATLINASSLAFLATGGAQVDLLTTPTFTSGSLQVDLATYANTVLTNGGNNPRVLGDLFAGSRIYINGASSGTDTPRNLTGTLALGNIAKANVAACDTAHRGAHYWDTTDSVEKTCDGTVWRREVTQSFADAGVSGQVSEPLVGFSAAPHCTCSNTNGTVAACDVTVVSTTNVTIKSGAGTDVLHGICSDW